MWDTSPKRKGMVGNHNPSRGQGPKECIMKVRTNVKAGGMSINRSESLKVRTGVKAGGNGWGANRCESLRGAK